MDAAGLSLGYIGGFGLQIPHCGGFGVGIHVLLLLQGADLNQQALATLLSGDRTAEI